MTTINNPALADDVRAHYARVTPLAHAVFGGMPIVSTSFPDGLSGAPHWHTKPLPLEPSTIAWCLEKLGSLEFHSWFPAPHQPDRLGYARIMLEATGSLDAAHMRHAARLTRTALNDRDVDAILVQNGDGNLTLFIPFADAPAYDDVRTWLHAVANELALKHGALFSTEPNTRGGNLVHLHVTHNAVRGYSSLPYALRARPDLPVNLPIAWSDLDTIENGSVTIATFPAHFRTHGDTLFIEHRRLAEQRFSQTQTERRAAQPQHLALPSKGTTISAALQILADGITRSADAILDEAIRRGLLAADYKARYVYTALIEYIARANGNGRKPSIVQDEMRNFRINEPPDDWPDLAAPASPAPDPAAQALAARLTAAAHGTDPASFEVAVCDAFAHLGFITTHVGGEKAPTAMPTRCSARSAIA